MSGEIPRGAELFRWAVLAEKFKALPHEIAALTDLQINELLLHKRDKDGALVPPESLAEAPAGPPTRASRLAGIVQLQGLGLITPERAEEMRREVEERYARPAE